MSPNYSHTQQVTKVKLIENGKTRKKPKGQENKHKKNRGRSQTRQADDVKNNGFKRLDKQN